MKVLKTNQSHHYQITMKMLKKNYYYNFKNNKK